MSGYLSNKEFDEILKQVSVYRLSSIKHEDLISFKFDCGNSFEYKDFLFEKAEKLDQLSISKTYLIIHNTTKELIGYFSLSANTIKLTPEEKMCSDLNDVEFMFLPAIKIGKLAINKSLSTARKGYGSFAIELALIKAYQVAKSGLACRFLTVDADIEYDKNTPNFYIKNGFVFNSSKKLRKSSKTISMRKDIYN